MKKLMILFSAIVLFAINTAAQGTGEGTGKSSLELVRDLIKDKEKTAAVGSLEAELQNYITAVVTQNAEGVYQYVNPSYIKTLGGKDNALELINFEIETSNEKDLKITNVKSNSAAQSLSSASSPQKIKVNVEIKSENLKKIFDGEITAVSVNNRWYFVHQKTILESFGVKEFENAKEKTEEKSKETLAGLVASRGILNSQAISLPSPVYPKAAKAVGAKGAVNVEVLIDENGNVTSAEAVSGHPLLRAAAVKAASEAKFKPFKLSGQSAKAKGIIIYNFTL